MSRILLRSAIALSLAFGAAGCASTAIGVTGKVVGTTAKVGVKTVGAAGRAVIPGDSRKKDRD